MAEGRTYVMNTRSPKKILLGGKVVIGAAGAISSQSGEALSGGTVSQTGSKDGRYGIAFYKTFQTIHTAWVNMVGPDDAAFPTATGSDPQLRLLATSGLSLQTKRPDTQADADPASGSVLVWGAIVSDF